MRMKRTDHSTPVLPLLHSAPRIPKSTTILSTSASQEQIANMTVAYIRAGRFLSVPLLILSIGLSHAAAESTKVQLDTRMACAMRLRAHGGARPQSECEKADLGTKAETMRGSKSKIA